MLANIRRHRRSLCQMAACAIVYITTMWLIHQMSVADLAPLHQKLHFLERRMALLTKNQSKDLLQKYKNEMLQDEPLGLFDVQQMDGDSKMVIDKGAKQNPNGGRDLVNMGVGAKAFPIVDNRQNVGQGQGQDQGGGNVIDGILKAGGQMQNQVQNQFGQFPGAMNVQQQDLNKGNVAPIQANIAAGQAFPPGGQNNADAGQFQAGQFQGGIGQVQQQPRQFQAGMGQDHRVMGQQQQFQQQQQQLQLQQQNLLLQRKKQEQKQQPQITINIYDASSDLSDKFECVKLNMVQPPAPICIHPLDKDIYISKNIKYYGSWEPDIVNYLMLVLNGNQEAGLIDIGANIGEFSIIAAALGRNVLAVEPVLSNIRVFHKSIKLGQFDKKITILQNAIWNQRAAAYMILDATNQGGIFLSPTKLPGVNSEPVSAVLMDDITDYVPFKKAIMKVAVEHTEHRAFAHAQRLLNTVHVSHIIMNWNMKSYYIPQNTASEDFTLIQNLIQMLTHRGYSPTGLFGQSLDVQNWVTWPETVVWVLH